MEEAQQGKPGSRLKRIAVVLLLLAVALGLRFYGIGRESFWDDEVWAVVGSDGSVAKILQNNANDVHPPFFPLALHFWRAALGDSDIRIRAYSLPWSVLGLLALFLLARDIGGWTVASIALILGAVNPLHIYFAQEARNYSQVVALLSLGSWCLWRWITVVSGSPQSSKWRWWAVGYTLCALGAIYTHYMSVMVLVAQGLFALLWFAAHKRWTSVAGYLASALVVMLLFLPWFLYVFHFRPTFYHHALAWMTPPTTQDYYSFLGREFFWGQVMQVWGGWQPPSPHGWWWQPTMVLPLAVFAVCLWHLFESPASDASQARQRGGLGIIYLFWLMAGPLILVVLTNHYYHPLYFRSRFALFLLPSFLILSAMACATFRNRRMTWLAAAVLGGVMLAGSGIMLHTREKLDWRGFVQAWQKRQPAPAAVFFPRGIEVVGAYYLKHPYVSPTKSDIEKLLPQLEGSDLWVCSVPGYTFFMWDWQTEFDYYQWLLCLGKVHDVRLPNSLFVQSVSIPKPLPRENERLYRWFEPRDIYRKIEGFGVPSDFSAPAFDPATSTSFRWSVPTARFCLRDCDRVSTVILNVQLPPAPTPEYRPALKIYTKRGENNSTLFASPPAAEIGDYRSGPFEVQLRVPPGAGPLWIGWTINGVKPASSAPARDDRELGLRINWIGAKKSPP